MLFLLVLHPYCISLENGNQMMTIMMRRQLYDIFTKLRHSNILHHSYFLLLVVPTMALE